MGIYRFVIDGEKHRIEIEDKLEKLLIKKFGKKNIRKIVLFLSGVLERKVEEEEYFNLLKDE